MTTRAPAKHLAAHFAAAVSDAPGTTATVTSTWSRLPGGVVGGSEIVILALKPSLWKPVIDSAAWLVASALLGIAIIAMNTPLPGLSAASTGQLVILIGIARLVAATLAWASQWYVLTNQRVLEVRGIRSPKIWACPLLEVRNTYLNMSTVEQWAGLGSITFVTQHPDEAPRSWQAVHQPIQVHDKIRRAIERAIDDHGL